MGIYKRHTLAHHQFFTDNERRSTARGTSASSSSRPTRWYVPRHVAGAGRLLRLAGLANAGWLLLMTNIALYLNYEFFHFCCHVKDDRLVRHIPFVNTIRRHHIAHHNTAIMMERNFNLTYPIADWFFGTSDLTAGCSGIS